MRTPRLFVDCLLRDGTPVTLEGDRAHYLRSVLRMRAGDTVELFDGTGGAWHGHVASIERHAVTVDGLTFSPADRESPLKISLGLGVSKRAAMDFTLQKCTELGVHAITPVRTRYSDLAGKTMETRTTHWQEVIRSACEQCERNVLPRLDDAAQLQDWVANADGERFVAHPGDHARIASLETHDQAVSLLVGPEGGLSDGEFEMALAAGFTPISLGPRILRVESAAIALVAILQSRFGDL